MRLRPLIILVALTSARVAFGYQSQTIASLATDLVPRFGLSYTQLGALIGAYMLLGAFAALPLGLLGRRLGEGLVLGAGLVLMTAGAVYGGLAETAVGIGLGRGAAGLGAVAMIVLQNKIIAEWFTGPLFMLAISVTVCAFPVGVGLAGLVLPYTLDAAGLHAALLTGALPAGLSLLLFVVSYREPAGGPRVTRRFALPSGMECLLLSIAGVTWMAYTAGFSGFASYLPATLAQKGYGVALIGTVMAVGTWGNVPGTLAGGGLAVRLGGFNIFLAGTLFLAVGMLALSQPVWPIASAVVFGVLGSIQPGIVMAAATLSARPENRAVGMGLFYTIYYIGGAVAPALCGVAADWFGRPEGALYAATLLSLFAIPAFLLHRGLIRREGSSLVRDQRRNA